MEWDWVHLVKSATGEPTVADKMTDKYGEFGTVKICRGNQSIRRQPVSVPLGPQQITRDRNLDQTQAVAVGSSK